MLFQLTLFPTDKRGDSVSADVSRVIDKIDRSGLPYRVTAMATIIEGEWGPVMRLIDACRRMLRKTHSRVYISIVVDDRAQARRRLTGKVESIERRLGREVRK